MLQRLSEQRELLTLYMARYRKRKLELIDIEWAKVDQLVKILSAFEKASRHLCRENESLSSIVSS